jgi:hypothetical protein
LIARQLSSIFLGDVLAPMSRLFILTMEFIHDHDHSFLGPTRADCLSPGRDKIPQRLNRADVDSD